jgi:hypothetical protein
MAGSVVQVVEHMPSKHQALSSTISSSVQYHQKIFHQFLMLPGNTQICKNNSWWIWLKFAPCPLLILVLSPLSLLSSPLLPVYLSFLSPPWHLRTRRTFKPITHGLSPTTISFYLFKKLTNAKHHNLWKCHEAWKMPTFNNSRNNRLISEEECALVHSTHTHTHTHTPMHTEAGLQSGQRGQLTY